MKYILHTDGDAFFAACEVSRRPDLRGKPVVVGEERGIACALTYEAKRLGISRGMPIFQIRREFPSATILSSHFELYEEFRRKLVAILEEYLPIVEAYSIDECFAILPEIKEVEIEPFVRKLKNRVQTDLGITFSFGVATTKTLAKIASKRQKPNGCVILIEPKAIKEALESTLVGSVWGIGYKTSAQLLGKNIRTAHEFINTPLNVLEKYFNEPSLDTWHELQGEKILEVSNAHTDQKSIQATRSLRATNSKEILFSELSRNVETACEELRRMNLLTRKVNMFYKYADGTKHREWAEISLPVYTDDPKIILKELLEASKAVYQEGLRYKATGVTFLGLRRAEAIQEDLFGAQISHNRAKKHLETLDSINHKFGAWTIMHASSMKSVLERKRELDIRNKKDTYEYGLPLPYMGEVF